MDTFIKHNPKDSHMIEEKCSLQVPSKTDIRNLENYIKTSTYTNCANNLLYDKFESFINSYERPFSTLKDSFADMKEFSIVTIVKGAKVGERKSSITPIYAVDNNYVAVSFPEVTDDYKPVGGIEVLFYENGEHTDKNSNVKKLLRNLEHYLG